MNLSPNIVYIGDGSKKFIQTASDNRAEHIDIPSLNFTDFTWVFDVILNANEVVFCKPNSWKDPDYEDIFEGLASWTRTKKSINYTSTSFEIPECLHTLNERKNNAGPQVWVGGCSFAHGEKLEDQDKRYGQLIADKLGMPVSFLTHNGASNGWVADQLMKSDIQQGDVVIIGVTGVSRVPIYMNKDYYAVNIHSFTKDEIWKFITKTLTENNIPIDEQTLKVQDNAKLKRYISEEFLLSDHFFYDAINHIEQLANFFKKLKVKFLFVYVPEIECLYMSNVGKMLQYFASTKIPTHVIETRYVDRATDLVHPGPETHRLYAEEILQQLDKIY
jgi:hypothetical protein